jgi:hypothetical protein
MPSCPTFPATLPQVWHLREAGFFRIYSGFIQEEGDKIQALFRSVWYTESKHPTELLQTYGRVTFSGFIQE